LAKIIIIVMFETRRRAKDFIDEFYARSWARLNEVNLREGGQENKKEEKLKRCSEEYQDVVLWLRRSRVLSEEV